MMAAAMAWCVMSAAVSLYVNDCRSDATPTLAICPSDELTPPFDLASQNDMACEPLWEVLRSDVGIRELNLSYNNLAAAGAYGLASALGNGCGGCHHGEQNSPLLTPPWGGLACVCVVVQGLVWIARAVLQAPRSRC